MARTTAEANHDKAFANAVNQQQVNAKSRCNDVTYNDVISPFTAYFIWYFSVLLLLPSLAHFFLFFHFFVLLLHSLALYPANVHYMSSGSDVFVCCRIELLKSESENCGAYGENTTPY